MDKMLSFRNYGVKLDASVGINLNLKITGLPNLSNRQGHPIKNYQGFNVFSNI